MDNALRILHTRDADPTRSVRDQAEELIGTLWDRLMQARSAFPNSDYAARLYRCEPCDSILGAIAPMAALHDSYRCPRCRQSASPLSPVLRRDGVGVT